MIHYTAQGLAYADADTPVVDLAAVTKTMAEAVDARLATRGLTTADIEAYVAAGWFTDTGAVALTLAAGVTGLTGGSVTARKVGRRVQLSWPVSGTLTPNMNVATLPAGFRPATYQRLATPTSDATTTVRRLNIDTAGNVLVNASGSGNVTWQSLDVSFLAA